MKKTLISAAALAGSLLLFGIANAAVTPFDDASIVSSGGNPGYAAQITSDAAVPPGDGGLTFDDANGQTFGSLTTLSTDYNVTDDNCGGGSPRFSIGIDTNNDGVADGFVKILIGPSPNFTGCASGWQTTGNLIGNNDAGRYDFSQFGGSPFTTYSNAPASVLNGKITEIDIVDDSSWDAAATGGDGEMTTLIDNTDINGTTFDYTPAPTPSVTTNSATEETTSSATLNGTNGPVNADQVSFWWGTTAPTTPITTPGSNPAATSEWPGGDWQHDNGLAGVSAGQSFSENVSGLTPGATYYFVAWVEVGGIWYPGQTLTFVVPMAAGVCPANLVPAASPLETVTVNSASDTAAASTMSLTSGQPYLLEASGTWTNAGGPSVADAMYSSFDNWTHYQEGQDAGSYFLGPNEFNLEIDGQFANWGPYDGTNHAYAESYTGTGSPVSFLVFDGNSNDGPSATNSSWYGDNSGSLSVAVYQCVVPPPPANACANPTSAPAGYTLVKGTKPNGSITLSPDTMFVSDGNGNNRITGPDGNYIVCTGTGNDSIKLGNGDDVITDKGGNNTVTVGNGDTAITTGAGNDKITAGVGTDVIDAGNGNNTVKASDGNNTISAGSGNDKITVGNGDNTIDGGSGNNTVNAGTGTNTITTGGGNDKITTQSTGNAINAGGGNNTVHQL